jgi:SAM-dependent methyltransferase
MGLSMATAELWVERWERQQQRYAVDREERFTVIVDVVEHVTAARTRPLVVDLGCGPGSLAARLAQRMPHADIVAVDMDPLLLELARTHHAAAGRYVETVIGEDGWTDRLSLDRPLDAAVSTTALHYLPKDTLRETYQQLAALLRPGGVLVNGDHLPQDGNAPAQITAHVGHCRAERRRALAQEGWEDWDTWWTAVSREPELAGLLAERRRQPGLPGSGNNGLSLSDHLELVRQAGFAQAGPVWQYGDSCVLVAVR